MFRASNTWCAELFLYIRGNEKIFLITVPFHSLRMLGLCTKRRQLE